MPETITVIDFASTGIRVVTGYYMKGCVYILNALEGEPLPLDENGYLEKKSCETSLALLLKTAKTNLKETGLGVMIAVLPSDGFFSKQGEGKTYTSDAGGHITQIDFTNATNMVEKQTKTPGKTILYNAPYSFGDDNQLGYTSFPQGHLSDHLSVLCDSLMVDESSYLHYQAILSDLHLDIYLQIPSPFGAVYSINFLAGGSTYLGLCLDRDSYTISHVYKKRLIKSKTVRFGIKDAILKASEILSIPFEKVDEHFALYGFEKDPGFLYKTDEGKTLEEYASAFHEAFKDMYDDLLQFHKENTMDAQEDMRLVFYGVGQDIPGFALELSEIVDLNAYGFSSYIIGARDSCYLNAIGGIILSAETYQKSIAKAKMRDGDMLMRNQSFSKKQ